MTETIDPNEPQPETTETVKPDDLEQPEQQEGDRDREDSDDAEGQGDDAAGTD